MGAAEYHLTGKAAVTKGVWSRPSSNDANNSPAASSQIRNRAAGRRLRDYRVDKFFCSGLFTHVCRHIGKGDARQSLDKRQTLKVCLATPSNIVEVGISVAAAAFEKGTKRELQ